MGSSKPPPPAPQEAPEHASLHVASLTGAEGRWGSPGCFMSHLPIPGPSHPSTADIMVVFTHKSGQAVLLVAFGATIMAIW